MGKRSRIFKPAHAEPGEFWLDYILLPYGDFYAPTREIAKAGKGDILRFHNGRSFVIERVLKIPQDETCDMLCRLRYGVPWKVAYQRWQSNAVLEGHDKSVLSSEFCLWVLYGSVYN